MPCKKVSVKDDWISMVTNCSSKMFTLQNHIDFMKIDFLLSIDYLLLGYDLVVNKSVECVYTRISY